MMARLLNANIHRWLLPLALLCLGLCLALPAGAATTASTTPRRQPGAGLRTM